MSNRTNRTLSANNTGLNLGTRSFALVTGADLDLTPTLRFRHASHPGAVARVERMRHEPSITMPRFSLGKPDGKPGDVDRGLADLLLDSSPRPSWPYSSSRSWACAGEGRSQVVAEAPPEPRTVVVVDEPSGRSVRRQAQSAPTQAQSRPAASARACQASWPAGRSARANDLALASAVAS
jgi:hypothetical protein